ncbi:MAG: DUF1800 domain-containing protein [Chloroflexi bacterium]|nr:DUF1800 domain-containing protein [Chloroflexota bacterium]
MTLSRRSFLQIGGAAAAASALTVGSTEALHWVPPSIQANPALVPPNIHLLNRITWGATPDAIAAIDAVGYEAYLEEQLTPERIDDGAADSRLRPYTAVLNLSLPDLYSTADPEALLVDALLSAVLLRAVHSRRQLLERVVEFWSDHFNVAGEDQIFHMGRYYNQAIRDHALGNFRTLVLETAKHPAMLIYLDNFVNIAEHPNENYARELLELHTLGVNGGYTEDDVVNVARAFTGWQVNEQIPGGFHFNPNEHDTDAKRVLGESLPAGRGIEDGLHVIDMAARHPATAQFISRKLCIHFVSDTPPQSLVNSTAAVFTANNGEIRPVLRHLFNSDEFKASAGQKLRRPLTFYVAAMRAAGASFTTPPEAQEHLSRLGQVPYNWLPPNGYPAVAAPWMTTNGLLARWNVAMRITEATQSGDFTGMRVHLHELIGRPVTVGELVDNVSTQIFGYQLPAPDLQTFIRYASDDAGAATPVTPALLSRKLGTLFGLMLASPAFQWH